MDSGIYVWKLGGVPKYVGQGKNVEKRMNANHVECKVLFYAVNKYGFDSFEKEIICYCEPSDMGEFEKYYIKELGTHVSEGGYNISWGGDTPMLGLKMSKETKQKMSESHIGINDWMVGKKHSEETKKKMSDGRIGNSYSLGFIHSEETRNKMSKARIGKKRKTSASIYIGVSFDSSRNKWFTSFTYNKKQIHVGRFPTELEAAIAHDNYCVEHNIDRPLNF